jgi:hypothetical protein
MDLVRQNFLSIIKPKMMDIYLGSSKEESE